MTHKKGDISIVLLVFMCVFLFAFALFSFVLNGSKINGFILDSRNLDRFYLEEEKAMFYLSSAVEQGFVEVYSNGNGVVDINLLKENVKSKINDVERNSDLFKQIKDKINQGGFDVKFDGDNVIVDFGEQRMSDDLSVREKSKILGFIPNPLAKDQERIVLGVSYSPKIVLNLNVHEIGLNSIGEIEQARVKCLAEKDLKGCMDGKLVYFDVSVVGKKITLTSKKSFLINGEIKKIQVIGQ